MNSLDHTWRLLRGGIELDSNQWGEPEDGSASDSPLMDTWSKFDDLHWPDDSEGEEVPEGVAENGESPKTVNGVVQNYVDEFNDSRRENDEGGE